MLEKEILEELKKLNSKMDMLISATLKSQPNEGNYLDSSRHKNIKEEVESRIEEARRAAQRKIESMHSKISEGNE